MTDADAARQAFNKFDLNGDGFVTPDEFKQAMSAMGDHTFTVGQAEAVLNAKDQNGDGLLSFEEFLDVYHKAQEH
ncbi:hypothetical protein SRB5_07030 [Streptomyces sp. RB5]|uniref:EF-hand domain-containing protein n=1 Tax=Streptomyces smaragdinus TaxID=2585196 RepID=A0A7K0CBW1_9ACTN|nr:EF-hand domain-containing protein [Streptomyces smaragdinus]MQY10592.1 hypothetical protein [Streptomyces smaragdinus]